MTTWLLIGVLGTMLAFTVPAAADHTSAPPAAPGDATPESSLGIDLKLGPDGFRFRSRLFGRHGYAGGAWLNGQTRRNGFSLDGGVEHDGRAHDFQFNADIDEWLRRASHRGVTDL
jgi:hypothetical protein